jgi:invasion protein IalB
MWCIVLRCFAAPAFACLVATSAIAAETELPALTYSPWTKICLENTCFTGSDGRSDCGPAVAVWLIERNGDTKKTLRVRLPTRVSLEAGVRIIIDQGQAIERAYTSCHATGCIADYDAGPELVDQLRRAQTLVLKAIDKANSPISLTLPLVDFANAYDGPPQEMKVREEVLSELQARLDRQRRAGEERKARCEAR